VEVGSSLGRSRRPGAVMQARTRRLEAKKAIEDLKSSCFLARGRRLWPGPGQGCAITEYSQNAPLVGNESTQKLPFVDYFFVFSVFFRLTGLHAVSWTVHAKREPFEAASLSFPSSDPFSLALPCCLYSQPTIAA